MSPLVFLTAALWATPASAAPSDRLLMHAWYAQNDVCRGGDDDRMCRWRDDTGRLLARRGWAWTSRDGWVRVDR